MSNVDLTWARTIPQFGTTQPIYPSFSPPKLDAAAAYEAANSVQAGKLGNQIKQNEIANAPLDTALKNADLAGKNIQNKTSETEATQRSSLYNIDQVDASVSAIDPLPDNSPEQAAAIDREAQRLKDAGVPDAQVAAFRDQAHHPDTRAEVHRRAQQERTIYQQTAGYSSGSSAAVAREDAQARQHVDTQFQKWVKDNPNKTPEEQKQEYDTLWNQYHGNFPAGSPAAGATPTVAAPGVWGTIKDWWNTPPEFSLALPGGDTKAPALAAPEAAKTADIGAAKTAADAKLKAGPGAPATAAAKPPEAPTQAKTSEEQASDGDGSKPKPYKYGGDQTNTDAVNNWVKGLQQGEYFIYPPDGQTYQKNKPAGQE